MKEEIKIRYNPEEFEEITQRAKNFGTTVEGYQREVSLKAKVKIELKE